MKWKSVFEHYIVTYNTFSRSGDFPQLEQYNQNVSLQMRRREVLSYW